MSCPISTAYVDCDLCIVSDSRLCAGLQPQDVSLERFALSAVPGPRISPCVLVDCTRGSMRGAIARIFAAVDAFWPVLSITSFARAATSAPLPLAALDGSPVLLLTSNVLCVLAQTMKAVLLVVGLAALASVAWACTSGACVQGMCTNIPADKTYYLTSFCDKASCCLLIER